MSSKLVVLNKQKVLATTLTLSVAASILAPSFAHAGFLSALFGGGSQPAASRAQAQAPVAAPAPAPAAKPVAPRVAAAAAQAPAAAAPAAAALEAAPAAQAAGPVQAAAPVQPPVVPQAVKCDNLMTTPPPEMAKRLPITNASQSSAYAKTSPARESAIESTRAGLEDFILNFTGEYGRGDIPPMRFIAEPGLDVKSIVQANGLNHVITRLVVKGSDPILRGTLLLPVSGHNGNANAKIWALNDTYSVKVDTLNESKRTSGAFNWAGPRAEKYLVKNVKSLGFVTVQEIEIPLNPDPKGSVIVLYYRNGSAGPGGYVEGRIMEIFWDKTP